MIGLEFYQPPVGLARIFSYIWVERIQTISEKTSGSIPVGQPGPLILFFLGGGGIQKYMRYSDYKMKEHNKLRQG